VNQRPPTSIGSELPHKWRTAHTLPAPALRDGGISRYRDRAFSKVPVPPFPGYIDSLTFKPSTPGQCRVKFACCGKASRDSCAGSNIVQFMGLSGASFYATGEQAGPLLRNGTIKTLWNNDHFDYTEKSKNLYQSHPFVLAVREDGSSVGILVETTHRCDIDLRSGVRFIVHGPSPAVVIFERSTPQEVLTALHELTGNIPMPPRWALGYHQCRWSYEPAQRFDELAYEFRQRNIPCDVLWFDIDYMDGFRCFTFDEHKFSDVRALNQRLHAKDFRTIYMIDCGIKADPQYSVYAQGRRDEHFITDNAGQEYNGEVWPGPCAFPDFTRKPTREWWAALYNDFMAHGIDGVWNDMNEPAVFKGVEKTMPISNLHRADDELGGPGTHAAYHNLYGMLMVRATREGIARANPSKRPFVLTRSNFIGGQRYAATWTGDNRSDWNHLRWSISMALNLTLSAQPFAGPDIGGFIGNADAQLFARWMGIGALLPFARAHSEKTTLPHEPWAFGPACERTCRLALERRYKLLPYLYTLFWRAAHQSQPIVAPLFFADPTDPKLRSVDDAFLLGPDLLVQCAVTPGTEPRKNPLLSGWKPIEVLDGVDGPIDAAQENLPTLFLRPGAALPLAPLVPSTAHLDRGGWDLTLITHETASEGARCQVYNDSGDGLSPQAWSLQHFHVKNGQISSTQEGDARYALRAALRV
jgi:alpha-glucosidase